MSPRISIIVPTLNSGSTLRACLESIRSQEFRDFEIIVVDGPSTDDTPEIAKSFGARYYFHAGSLPDARNFGARQSAGRILVSLDSDMVAGPGLLDEICRAGTDSGPLIIPEKGAGRSLISRCEALEKECTIGHEPMESARVFSREAFESAGGYDPDLLFGEDRDFHERVSEGRTVGRTTSVVYHVQDHVGFWGLIRKSFVYGRSARLFFEKRRKRGRPLPADRLGFFLRWKTLLSDPPLAVCMLFLKAAEYWAFGSGYLVSFFMPYRKR